MRLGGQECGRNLKEKMWIMTHQLQACKIFMQNNSLFLKKLINTMLTWVHFSCQGLGWGGEGWSSALWSPDGELIAPCSGYSIAVKQITPQLNSFKQAFYLVDSFVRLEFRKGSPWQPSTGCLSCYGRWQLDPQASESSAGLDIQDVTCTQLAVNAGHQRELKLGG